MWCLAHGELAWLILEPDTGLDYCPRIILSCVRARTSACFPLRLCRLVREALQLLVKVVRVDDGRGGLAQPVGVQYGGALPAQLHSVLVHRRVLWQQPPLLGEALGPGLVRELHGGVLPVQVLRRGRVAPGPPDSAVAVQEARECDGGEGCAGEDDDHDEVGRGLEAIV